MSSYFESLRRKRGVSDPVRNRPQTPAQRRRRKTAPVPARPCRVKNPNGEYYDLYYDLELTKDVLRINPNNPDGHLFQSRRKAANRVYWTLWTYKRNGVELNGPEFILENVR